MSDSKKSQGLFEASGQVSYHDSLTGFLYELMRDHLTPGVVEELVRNQTNGKTDYSNGWLASYAHYLAGKLQNQTDSDVTCSVESETVTL